MRSVQFDVEHNVGSELLRPPHTWSREAAGGWSGEAGWSLRPPPEVHMLNGELKPKQPEPQEASRSKRKAGKEQHGDEPKEKASSYGLGTKRKGRDGKMWEVQTVGDSLAEVWVALSPGGRRAPNWMQGKDKKKGKKGAAEEEPSDEDEDEPLPDGQRRQLSLKKVLEHELKVACVTAKKGYEELVYEAVVGITGEARLHNCVVPNDPLHRFWCKATCPGCERVLSILVVPGLDVVQCTYCGHWSFTTPPSFEQLEEQAAIGRTTDVFPVLGWLQPGEGDEPVPDCGKCWACLDKPKYGGPGIKHKACLAKDALLLSKGSAAASGGAPSAAPLDAMEVEPPGAADGPARMRGTISA